MYKNLLLNITLAGSVLCMQNNNMQSTQDQDNIAVEQQVQQVQQERRMAPDEWTNAAKNGNVEYISTHINEFAGMVDKFEMTAMMYAAQNDRTDVVKLLLEYEKGMKDFFGQTALIYASASGHRKCMEILSENPEEVRATKESRQDA